MGSWDVTEVLDGTGETASFWLHPVRAAETATSRERAATGIDRFMHSKLVPHQCRSTFVCSIRDGYLGLRWVNHSDSPATMSAMGPDVKFNADGLLPAIAQEAASGEVLMLAWMDREALRRTLSTGRATYWSRSRAEYWVKGETSGHTQRVESVHLDCDGDTILLRVHQEGAACHTGNRTCFFTELRDGDVA